MTKTFRKLLLALAWCVPSLVGAGPGSREALNLSLSSSQGRVTVSELLGAQQRLLVAMDANDTQTWDELNAAMARLPETMRKHVVVVKVHGHQAVGRGGLPNAPQSHSQASSPDVQDAAVFEIPVQEWRAAVKRADLPLLVGLDAQGKARYRTVSGHQDFYGLAGVVKSLGIRSQ